MLTGDDEFDGYNYSATRRRLTVISLLVSLAAIATTSWLLTSQGKSRPTNGFTTPSGSPTPPATINFAAAIMPTNLGFSVSADSASRTVTYAFSVVSNADMPARLTYNGAGVPNGLRYQPLASDPRTFDVPAHGTATITLRFLVISCAAISTASAPLEFSARTPAVAQETILRLTPLTIGADNQPWQVEVGKSLCTLAP